MQYVESILRVLVVGLLLGAGLPAVFAVGLRVYSSGTGTEATAANAALKFVGLVLFAFVAAAIVLAILWITRGTIIHHFGVDPFPFLPKK